MCRYCQQTHGLVSRRAFLGGSIAAAASMVGGLSLPRAFAHEQAGPPPSIGQAGRRTLIRGGYVLSMDEHVGEFEGGDVLVEGSRIVEIASSIEAGDAEIVDARGRVVMPGFVDTHLHQFETTLRSTLADGLLANNGRRGGGAASRII